MGRVTWGGGVTGADLDNAERNQFKPYDGPIPTNGVYTFKIKWLRSQTSQAGNPKLTAGLELVPRQSRPDEKPYKGFFLVDGIPVMNEDWSHKRVAAFLDAIGVSGDDFAKRTVDDGSEQGNIVKIGKVVPVGRYVLVNLVDGKDQNGNARKEVSFGGYYAPPQGPAASEPDGDDTDDADADDAPPF